VTIFFLSLLNCLYLRDNFYCQAGNCSDGGKKIATADSNHSCADLLTAPLGNF
jgi:hypothetical protein